MTLPQLATLLNSNVQLPAQGKAVEVDMDVLSHTD